MNHEHFRLIESQLAGNHADMATLLGISEVSVKRYATGAQPIPSHIARLAVSLSLIEQQGLTKIYVRALAKYHGDT